MLLKKNEVTLLLKILATLISSILGIVGASNVEDSDE
jgi:hypothetical protein